MGTLLTDSAIRGSYEERHLQKKKRTKQDEKSTKMARGKGRLTNEKPEFKQEYEKNQLSSC